MQTKEEIQTIFCFNGYKIEFLKEYEKKLEQSIEEMFDHIDDLKLLVRRLNSKLKDSSFKKNLPLKIKIGSFEPSDFIKQELYGNIIELKDLSGIIMKEIRGDNEEIIKCRNKAAYEYFTWINVRKMFINELDAIRLEIEKLEKENLDFPKKIYDLKDQEKNFDFASVKWEDFYENRFTKNGLEFAKHPGQNDNKHSQDLPLRKPQKGDYKKYLLKIAKKLGFNMNEKMTEEKAKLANEELKRYGIEGNINSIRNKYNEYGYKGKNRQ